MSDSLDHKLVEAIPPEKRPEANPILNGVPEQTPAVHAEQQREAQEGRDAHEHPETLKQRLVDLGKANHSGGHSKGRVGDAG